MLSALQSTIVAHPRIHAFPAEEN